MNVIIFILKIFTFSVAFVQIFAIILPCDFSFDRKYGYTCRVGDISITNSHTKVTKIGGDHAHEKKLFNRNDSDVLRVIMYDRHIEFLPINITIFFPYMKTLQVKKCGLRALTRAPDLRSLRRMYLGFNKIERIPEKYFWHFCRLEVLSLHGNQISNIPHMAFRDLIRLKRLSLNGNHLKTISSVVFTNCLNLEYVDLENNPLRSIQSSLLANQARLKKLLMRNCPIKAIESGFLSTFENATSLCAFFGGSEACIRNFIFPLDGNYKVLNRHFEMDCKPSVVTDTTTKHPITQKPRKKDPYKTPEMIFFENCTWQIHKDYAHYFKTSF